MTWKCTPTVLLTSVTTLLSMWICPSAVSFSFDLPSGFDTERSEAFETSLYFYSEPGDSIGQGQEVFFGPTEGNFSATQNFDNGVNFSFSNFNIVDFRDAVSWRASFAAPFEATLTPGSYTGATRFPFQAASNPGLSFTGDGRGCNRSGGQFDVLDVQYESGSVSSFDAVFAQYCENETGAGTPALFGRVRFNAPTSPPAVPEHPGNAFAVVAFGGLALLIRKRSRNKSST